MGYLYERIEADLIKLNNEGKDFKSLVEKNLAAGKINALFSLINEAYKKYEPNGVNPNFSLKNLDNLEKRLEDVENYLEEKDGYDDLLKTYDKIKLPDSSQLGNDDIKEYQALVNVVDNTMGCLTIAGDYNLNEEDMPVKPKDLIIAARNEADRIFSKDIFVEKPLENQWEYKIAQNFLKAPAKELFKSFGNKNFMKFNSEEEKANFINEVDSIASDIADLKITDLQASVENSYLSNFNELKIKEVSDLAKTITDTFDEYTEAYHESTKKNPGISKKLSNGRTIYAIREKVSQIVTKKDFELGIDHDSTFIKNFLNDPIDSMNKYYDEAIEELEDQKIDKMTTLISDYDKIDQDKEIAKVEIKKNIISSGQNVYNKFMKYNNDSWKELNDKRTKWFSNYFKENMDGLMIDESLNKNKGGFFENLFGTTSSEYKDFSNRLGNSLTDGVFKGDLDGLKVSAQAYLSHKLPSYVPLSHGYDEMEILKLDSTGKGRVMLALAVIDAVDEAKSAVKDNLNPDEFVPDHKEYDNDTDYYINKVNEVNSKNNDLNSFQDMVKNDIKNESISSNDINKNDNEISFIFDNNSIENESS